MVLIMKSDLWQVDDPLFLLSAHPLQSNHPAASNPSSAPGRCDTNPEVQSCLKLLSVFELLLSHTGLRLSQCWSHSACPLSLSFRVLREGLRQSNPCPPDPVQGGSIVLSSGKMPPGNLTENPSRS